MVLWERLTLAVKSEDLSSIPGIHMGGRRELNHTRQPSDLHMLIMAHSYKWSCACTCITHTQVKCNLKKKRWLSGKEMPKGTQIWAEAEEYELDEGRLN